MRPVGWPEHGREDEAVRELVANWHLLTPFVRAAIMELARGGRVAGRRVGADGIAPPSCDQGQAATAKLRGAMAAS
jgi:hypothetical protein